MKFRRIIFLLLVLTISFVLSSCKKDSDEVKDEDNGESLCTKYYTPVVSNQYESCTVGDILTDYINYKAGKKHPTYDYAGIEVQMETPIDYYGEKINDDYILGRVKEDFDSKNNSFWIDDLSARYFSFDNFFPELNYLIKIAFDIDRDGIEVKGCYKKPYCFEYETQFASNPASVKIVFGDNFLVESMLIDYNINKLNLKFNYFNESDLPTQSGEIDRQTYQDIAYVRFYKEAPNFTKMYADIQGTNIILDTIETEAEDGFFIIEGITGNARIKAVYNLQKLPYYNNSGIMSYNRVFDSVEIIDGDIKDEGITRLKYMATAYLCAFDNVFITYQFGGRIYSNAYVTFTNNPLAAKIETVDYLIDAEFDEYGAITEYTYEKKETYKYKVQFTYI